MRKWKIRKMKVIKNLERRIRCKGEEGGNLEKYK
jgi:hypothetical protein